MAMFVPFNRDQPFLLPPELKDWLPADALAHVVVAAVDRMGLDAFEVRARPGGKAQYHPRRRLALLVYCHANGLFSSRPIERAGGGGADGGEAKRPHQRGATVDGHCGVPSLGLGKG
jgi:hypothetical protein